MTPARFKTVENRRRQWAFLAARAPDVALLQECRPSDLHDHAPGWMADEYDIVGTIPARWIACSAVVARKSLRLRELDRALLPEVERRWLNHLSGYVATATVELGDRQTNLASVHATAIEVDTPDVGR